MEDGVVGIVQQLLSRPVYLAPILLLVAMVIYAILKKLVKMALIVAIAGALYLLLLQNFGPGA